MPLWYLTKEKKDELCKQRDNKEKELEDLKCKSASDLWKEDLAAFVEELDVVEAKQAQDESAGIVGKPLKVKGGKPKVKKAQLAEVMPSPHGIRVVPRITAEMKAEAEKKTKKKVKSEKNEFDENQDENTSGEKESASLKQKVKTEQGVKRQATLPFKPLKKTKKRNPWSDSESDSESDFEPLPQRERVVRQAAAKVKPMVILDSNSSSSDEEFEFQGDSEGNSESDTNSKKKAPPKPKPAPKETTEKAAKAPKQKAVPSAVPVQDVPEEKVSQAPAAPSIPEPSTKAVPKKPAAAKKAGATKDNQPSIVDILAKKKAAPKPKPAAKEGPLHTEGDNAKGRKVMKRQPKVMDSDSDSDFGSKPAKSLASKKSKLQDDAFTNDESPVPQPRARPGRLKKPVQYLEESSEDDMF